MTSERSANTAEPVQIASIGARSEIAEVVELFKEYAQSLPIDLEYQGFTAELQKLPGAYQPPTGALFVARVDGAGAGCVALRQLKSRVCEMKRLYVRPGHRGRGIGPSLVSAALAAARTLGYEEIWLDTLPSMTAAHRLYLSLGFREIERYGADSAPGTRYYGLRLQHDATTTLPARAE